MAALVELRGRPFAAGPIPDPTDCRQRSLPVLRSRQIARSCPALSSTAVVKTEPPVTIGVAAESPGIGADHRTPLSREKLVGRFFALVEPSKLGPRQCIQSIEATSFLSAISPAPLPTTLVPRWKRGAVSAAGRCGAGRCQFS